MAFDTARLFYEFPDMSRKRAGPKDTLLFIDDDQDTLAMCRKLFKRKYTVLTANTGGKGLKAMKGRRVAVAIVDQRMPRMSGLEVLKRLKANFPETGRIVMTSYTEIEEVVKLTNIGRINSFIVKPWHNNQLKLVVDREVEMYRRNRTIAELEAKMDREQHTLLDLLRELDPEFAMPKTNTQLKKIKERLRRQVQGAAERVFVENLLDKYPDNISLAAKSAKINRTFLYRLMRRHDIEAPD